MPDGFTHRRRSTAIGDQVLGLRLDDLLDVVHACQEVIRLQLLLHLLPHRVVLHGPRLLSC